MKVCLDCTSEHYGGWALPAAGDWYNMRAGETGKVCKTFGAFFTFKYEQGLCSFFPSPRGNRKLRHVHTLNINCSAGKKSCKGRSYCRRLPGDFNCSLSKLEGPWGCFSLVWSSWVPWFVVFLWPSGVGLILKTPDDRKYSSRMCTFLFLFLLLLLPVLLLFLSAIVSMSTNNMLVRALWCRCPSVPIRCLPGVESYMQEHASFKFWHIFLNYSSKVLWSLILCVNMYKLLIIKRYRIRNHLILKSDGHTKHMYF